MSKKIWVKEYGCYRPSKEFTLKSKEARERSKKLEAKMMRVIPTRTKLTWREIRKVEADWSHDGGPAKEDIIKLVRHIRFIEYQLSELKHKVKL